jgi:hypothetical protein
VHELSIYSRVNDEDSHKKFFKEVGTQRLVYAHDITCLPEVPDGYKYIPIPNGAGMCVRIIF